MPSKISGAKRMKRIGLLRVIVYAPLACGMGLMFMYLGWGLNWGSVVFGLLFAIGGIWMMLFPLTASNVRREKHVTRTT